MHIVLKKSRRIFLGEENHSPLLRYSQKIPGRPKLNQLANNAVYWYGVSKKRSWGLHVRPTYHQTEKITEHRDCRRNNPGNNPESHSNANPGPNGHQVSLVHAIASGKNTGVDGLAGNMAVDDTGNDDLGSLASLQVNSFQTTYSWKGDPVGNLWGQWTSRAEGWRSNTITSIAVDDNSSNQVDGDVDTLE